MSDIHPRDEEVEFEYTIEDLRKMLIRIYGIHRPPICVLDGLIKAYNELVLKYETLAKEKEINANNEVRK